MEDNNREKEQINIVGKFTFNSIIEDAKHLVQTLFSYFKKKATNGSSQISILERITISGTLIFEQHVVGWFKKICNLNQEVDTPFVANAILFKEMLGTSPTKSAAIFQGVYNEEADEITHNQYVEADALDDKTQEILGSEPLVVLQ